MKLSSESGSNSTESHAPTSCSRLSIAATPPRQALPPPRHLVLTVSCTGIKQPLITHRQVPTCSTDTMSVKQDGYRFGMMPAHMVQG